MASSKSMPDRLIPVSSVHPSELLDKYLTLHVTDEQAVKALTVRPHYGRTHPIETFPCEIYVTAYDEEDRVRVWLKEQEADINKCSDYIYDRCEPTRMRSCWVCKWVQIDSHWLFDPAEDFDGSHMRRLDFYRLHGDRDVEYGDGGRDFLVYPVWIHEQLPVKESLRKRLLHALHQLNNQRQDFHASPSPVEDIIDPDLLPQRPPAEFNRDQWIERQRKQAEGKDRQLRTFNRDLTLGDYTEFSEHEQLRNSYQWIPSDFVIDKDGKVDIRTPIPHLPVLAEYRQTYGDIAQIFHAMLPMFEEMKLIRRDGNEEQRLQVIVKAQSYNLKAGMKYSGRWHTEGQTENIVAVGVYYLYIDEQLEGGALKFRPKCAPGLGYDTHMQIDHTVSCVETGVAVVFANSIPHRFQQIRNLTQEDGRRRTFLNFFVVDPERPILRRSNSIACSPKNVIVQTLREWNEGRLPELVLEQILGLLNFASLWDTEAEAKEFRARVRRAMLDEKSGWGWICWGNSGTTEFVRALCAWPPRSREESREVLHHTESD